MEKNIGHENYSTWTIKRWIVIELPVINESLVSPAEMDSKTLRQTFDLLGVIEVLEVHSIVVEK